MTMGSGASLLRCSYPCFSSIILTNSAIMNRKIKSLGVECRATTADNQYQRWNMSDDLAATLKSWSFPETFWTDYKRKMKEVGQLLLLQSNDDDENPIDSLVFVDAIQRVGVDHHFSEEIEITIRRQYNYWVNKSACFHDLHDVSLFFRLLRQQGYYVSADVFNNFKGKDGKFKDTLKQDIRGLMALYEAAQLSFKGENTIDEAEDFSREHLSAWLGNVDDQEWSQQVIGNTLRHPQHKSLAKLTAKSLLHGDALKGSKVWEKSVRELGDMDLLIAKSSHQEELLQISKWWKDTDLAEELPKARKQPVKWYTQSMGILINEPSLSFQRIELTKIIAFIHLIDDIFDLYGTIDELTAFTEAINRWDYAAIDMLPSYMRMSYKALLDTTNDVAYKVHKKHGHNPIDSLKATWASLCNAFLVEARWFGSGELPTAKAYLENGKVSSGVHVVLVHLFFLLGLGGLTTGGDEINLNHTSDLTSSVATILRLWDDLGSSKDEHQDGADGSYIKYYMKDEPKLSVTQARQHVLDMISNEWKNINQECFRLNHFSATRFKRASLNLARMVPLGYAYDENQRLPLLEEYVKTTLFN